MGSFEHVGTPRPDFKGELLRPFADDWDRSGFRFAESDDLDPVLGGDLSRTTLSSRDRRIRLVPGPVASVFPEGSYTTELKCGIAADPQCQDWTTAPTSGYVADDVLLEPELSYMLRVVGDDGQLHYGTIRVVLLGSDQRGSEIMIFDWA